MSTFKRLFNVGKGKAKVAQKGVQDALSKSADTPGEWADQARHRAADAAEALAEALRPDERVEAAKPVDAEPPESVEPAPPSEEAEPLPEVEARRPDPKAPKKRRL